MLRASLIMDGGFDMFCRFRACRRRKKHLYVIYPASDILVIIIVVAYVLTIRRRFEGVFVELAVLN